MFKEIYGAKLHQLLNIIFINKTMGVILGTLIGIPGYILDVPGGIFKFMRDVMG